MAMDTLKKSAYVAVGLPVDLVTRLRERVSSARDSLGELREAVSGDLTEAFDRWVEEGERLVGSIGERVEERREDFGGAVERGQEATRRAVETIPDVGRGIGAALTHPIAPIDAVDGIGPAYAEKLIRAGVVSPRALVERCHTADAAARLAAQTGISQRRLTQWAESADLARIQGVGDDGMSLLNALQIGSVESLSRASAGDLHQRASALNRDTGLVSAVPSETTLSEWISQAAAMTGGGSG